MSGEDFSITDALAYTAGGAVAGALVAGTFGLALPAATSAFGTIAGTSVVGGTAGVVGGGAGGLIVGAGTTIDDAVAGNATWGDVGTNGLKGMGNGAFYGGIAGAVGGAAFPFAASLTSGGIGGGFIAGSTSAMLGDAASQFAGMGVGLQDGYNTSQTAFAGIAGGGFGAYGGRKDPKLGGLVGSKAYKEPLAIARNALGIGKSRGWRSNQSVRHLYLREEAKIDSRINAKLPLERRARIAHRMRNILRTKAWTMMVDRAQAEALRRKYPNRSWDQTLNHIHDKHGFVGDDALHEILASSQRSRATVNKQFGLDAKGRLLNLNPWYITTFVSALFQS